MSYKIEVHIFFLINIFFIKCPVAKLVIQSILLAFALNIKLVD